MKTAEQIQAELCEPFAADVIGWKPQSVSGSRAMAVAYIDARDVENRLDEVVGIANWSDNYEELPSGAVRCTLSLRIDGEWVSKQDVGGESEQKDVHDRVKACHSDALKRAAVKWGIGRYLYSLPQSWVDYDAQKRQIVNPPKLPPHALPKAKQQAAQQQSPQAAPPVGLSPELVKVLTEMIAAIGTHDAYTAAVNELSRQKPNMTKQQFNTFAGLLKESSERIA